MKSAYRSVSFYIGQKEFEMQFKMNKLVAQCKQKCEVMHEKFSEKLEQVYTAYQKMSNRCQMIEQEMENLSKDKQEPEIKIAEKCRQKGKLDEMYNLAIAEVEPLKRSAIQPPNHLFSTQEPYLFESARMDNRDSIKKDWSILAPETPGPREDIWSARQSTIAIDPGNRMPTVHSSMTLKNLIFSPIKRPQISRNRTQLFTL